MVRFGEKFVPLVKVHIVGHFHKSGIWMRAGRVVVYTGRPTLMGRPLVVRISDGSIAVSSLIWHKGRYSVDATLARWSSKDLPKGSWYLEKAEHVEND